MPKGFLVILTLAILLITGYLTLAVNNAFLKAPSKSEIEVAVNQAQYFYRQKKARNEDFSNGPCLSNALMPGWVVDIAHNPRLAMDDLSQNQCAAYLEGSAQHFVELDIDGNLIRVK